MHGRSVLVGDIERFVVAGKGEVRMRVGNVNLVLRNVLHVPGIARNILSAIAATRTSGTVCVTSEGCPPCLVMVQH